MSLWQITWQRFGKPLTDLWRFGLWPEQSLTQLADGTTFAHSYLTKPQIIRLRILVSHPAWGDNLDVLRYALMCCVQYRVIDHDEPLEPIQPLDPIIRKSTLSVAEKALMAYNQTKRNGIGSMYNIRIICRRLEQLITPGEVESDTERALFMLRTKDIQALIDALNSVTRPTTMATLWVDAKWYYDRWKARGSKA